MGFLFVDVSRNSALALLIFGAFLIGQGGVFLRKTKLARAGRVMVASGVVVAVAGLVLFVIHHV